MASSHPAHPRSLDPCRWIGGRRSGWMAMPGIPGTSRVSHLQRGGDGVRWTIPPRRDLQLQPLRCIALRTSRAEV